MGSSKSIKIAITNGTLFYKNRLVSGNVLIRDDKIYDVVLGHLSRKALKDHIIVNAHDSYVSYGFIDPHVHFRAPGQEHKEDWVSGSKAAVKGGFTFVVDMPNNAQPSVDSKSLLKKNELAKSSLVNYGFYIGLTDKNSDSIKKIIHELKTKHIPVLGIKVYMGSTTGDLLVKDQASIKRSLESHYMNLFHCEDEELLAQLRNKDENSIIDHNAKRPPEAEESGIDKIIKAAKKAKTKEYIYICHVSSKKEINAIEKYRKDGYKIISEITPHHIFFDLLSIKDSNVYKVNPPIRPVEDVLEIRKVFNKGFFQVIGTDHAPHLKKEKDSSNPPSGFPGLESAFAVFYDLYKNRAIKKLEDVFKLLTSGYKILNIKDRGELKKGNFADITIIKKEENLFESKKTLTKADFSPFDGMPVECKVHTVIVGGNIIMRNGKFVK